MTSQQTLYAGGAGRPAKTPTRILSPAQACRSLLCTLAVWQRRIEQRRQLAELPERLLRDMGLTPVQARIEADKPFWRA